MSDPINGNNNIVNQQPIQNNAQNEVQNVNHQAPRELGNATMSKISFALRIIAGIFTFGLSELSHFILNKCTAPTPRQNQVQPQNPDMVPNNDPAVDNANDTLASNILNKTIPDNIKTALDEVVQQHRTNIGNKAIPQDINEFLSKPASNGRSLAIKLREAIKNSTVEVTPENIKNIFENILQEEKTYLALKEVIADKAEKDGTPLDDQSLHNITDDFLKKKTAQNNITTTEEAKQFIDNLPQGAKIWEKNTALSLLTDRNVTETKNFPENSIVTKAFTKVLNELKTNFPDTFKENSITELMQHKIQRSNSFVYKEIEKIIKNNDVNKFDQNYLEISIKAAILEEQRNQSMVSALKDKLTGAGLNTDDPQVVNTYAQIITSVSPELKTEFNNCNSAADLNNVLTKYGNVIDAKITEIKNNIQEMDNKYLSQVQPEVRPMLKQLIHATLFDNANKTKSDAFIGEQVAYMKNWKPLDSSTNFKGYNEVLNWMKTDLSHLEGYHGDDVNRGNNYNNNVHEQFMLDAGRGTYIFNNEQIERNAEPVINKVRELFTNAKDLQFITKLANQRIFMSLSPYQTFATINGNKLSDGKPFKNDGGELSHVDVLKLNLSQQPTNRAIDVGDKKSIVYDIKLSDDKKTGTLVFTRVDYLNTLTDPKTTVGSVEYNLTINFTLSAGNENGTPTLDDIKLTQKFGNPF